MDRDRRLSLTVGGLVMGGLFALGLAVLTLSSQSGIWSSHYRLVGYFDNVGGLIRGAPVWLAGKRVGGVESVRFDSDPETGAAVKVVMQLKQTASERIRADSVASIGTIGLLGDVYVEISLGTTEARILEDGDQLATLSPVDLNRLIAKVGSGIDDIGRLTTTLNSVISEFEREQGATKLADSVVAFSEVVEEVVQGEGVLHSLIYDEYEGGGVESIERSMALIEDILQQVAEGDGMIHALLYEPAGENSDEEFAATLRNATVHLNSILAKVDRGEGTLGLLLNDPTLYEELKMLVGGAGRSTVVRALIDLATPDEE
jgi:phospholipid/cholesterol/gamma-HCH transport system substrate-binding protein